MTQVKYTGRDDFRVLAADDLKKAGVEGFKQTSFARNTPVEVTDEVAAALVNENFKGYFGSKQFEIVEEQRDAAPATNGDAPAAPAAEKDKKKS